MSHSASDSYNKNPTPKARFTGIFIPVEILNIPTLTPTDMILLSWIDALYCEEHGGCFAKNDYLAKKLHLKEKTVSDIIAKLIKMGLVEKVGFDGRIRVIRACKERWYQPEADSGLNRRQHPDKTGGSILLEPEPHNIYSKEESKQQLLPWKEVAVVASQEEEKQAAKAFEITKEFAKKHGKHWIIPKELFLRLILDHGMDYVADQANHMCNQQERAKEDELDPSKKRKTPPVDNPKNFLSMACKENWASSIHTKKGKNNGN